MTRITFKLGIIYIFLAFLNITFFTIMVFENQVDIIVENAKYKAVEMTERIIAPLEIISEDATSTSKYADENGVTKAIASLLDGVVDNYIIFNEKSKVFVTKNYPDEINNDQIKNAVNAASAKNFNGKKYIFSIRNNEINFYLPFFSVQTGEITILFKMSLKEIDHRMVDLYRQVAMVIVVLIILHVAIGLILNLVIVKPLMALKRKTDEFSKGNFSARVKVKGNDELALVSSTFNSMADSVESIIEKLKNQNDMINMELDVAAQVQKGIYPQIRETQAFTIAVFDNPLEKVSGDFHDFIRLTGDRYGFFIADVSGHGVPAALITMKIKDLITVTSSNFNDPSTLLKFFNMSFSDLMDKFSSYFTAFYLIFDYANSKILYSSAGHPDAIVVHKNGTVDLMKSEGFVIGVSKEMSDTFQSHVLPVTKGDVFVLYTDGITEARDCSGAFFGDGAFVNAIKEAAGQSAEEIEKNIIARLREFTGNSERKDDETLIVIEVK